MRLLLVDNVYMYRTDEGVYYTPSIYNRDFFQRYLNVFDKVRLVAKTKHVDSVDENKYIRVDFPNVEIYELVYYHGMKDFIGKLATLIRQASRAKAGCDCTIYRVAQLESFLVYGLSLRKRPFALEVVNDPQSWASTGGVVKKFTIFMLKYMCKHANGVSYVTESYLQKKYPFSEKRTVFTSHYSSIELNKESIGDIKSWAKDRTFKLVHVANVIDGVGKGHDTVLHCLKQLIVKGYNVEVDFIGEGPGVERYKELAKTLEVSDSVHFTGRISDKATYMKYLTEHDALIFPSHSEGLPRVVIEAMACGLPCVASPVGGTPELIDDWCLVDYDDISGYVSTIIKLIDDPALYYNTSKKNILKAKEFESDALTLRRSQFYTNLKGLCK